MENFEEADQDRVFCDVEEIIFCCCGEETIFVVVGRNVEKTTLFWTVQNFAGKKIYLLHVHKQEQVVAFGTGRYNFD